MAFIPKSSIKGLKEVHVEDFRKFSQVNEWRYTKECCLHLYYAGFLRGERPYWWVNETDKYKHIQLSQYPLTCETGPGSPSGHAMVTTAVLFTMLPFILKQINCRLKTSSLQRRICHGFVWLCFFVIVSLVSLSRIFLATHFPHQVLGGVLGGIALSYTAQKHIDAFTQLNFKQCSIISCLLVVLTLVIYTILSWAIFDPSESVQKAQKWCANPAYIHIETRPFYALVRDAGAVLGIGLAHRCNYLYGLRDSNQSILSKVISGVLMLIMIQLLNNINVAFNTDVLSYLYGYIKSVMLVVLVIVVIPACGKLVKPISKSSTKSA